MPSEMIHELIRSKRRTLALQVRPDATLIVRAPERISQRAIDDFVRQNGEWIRRQREKAIQNYRPVEKKKYTEGETFLYLGDYHKLTLVEKAGEALSFNGSEFVLRQKDAARGEKVFLDWYKQQALDVCSERARFYAQKAGLSYKRISIRNAKTRWGSCGPQNNLNFNWRLILAPVHILDYVVVHEVMHIAEKNHGRKFWERVRQVCPGYREARKWLKTKHRDLEI